MQTKDFYFELPEELIAQRPVDRRRDSRLLVLDGDGRIFDKQFTELLEYLKPGDLLILNDTRVIPARLLGHKQSGGRVEILIERITSDTQALAHVRANKTCKTGNLLLMEEQLTFEVLGREGDLFKIQLAGEEPMVSALERVGRIPLPPYIDRDADEYDKQRYQTVYAQHSGAVAAPTAGLHFEHEVLAEIQNSGVTIGRLTLHVGAGTFQPVRSESIDQHTMHREQMIINDKLINQINDTRKQGGRIIAVGTTVVRALESIASDSGDVLAYSGETDIFISPGYRFRVIDAMITNFHLPESTLLMLVSAFAGTDKILSAYAHAVDKGYRFFSYGDAMLIEKSAGADQ